MTNNFSPFVKYPRTYHLPWSNPSSDDKVIRSFEGFEGEEIVVTVKWDGEQTTLYRDHIHARSLEPLTGDDASFVKRLHSRIAHEIPKGWRICGENIYAFHTIYYHAQNARPPFFKVFSIWNERNECLSWDETREWTNLLGLEMVDELYRGPWNENLLKNFYTPEFNGDPMEGYVVRLTRSFTFGEFRHVVAKFVRPNFVPSNAQHWKQGARDFNGRPIESVE